MKYTGWRAFAVIECGKRVQLISHHGDDLVSNFAEFRTFPSLVRGDVLLDGTIVVGTGSVAESRDVMTPGSSHFFIAFDLLAVNGEAIINEPLERRHRMMKERISDHMRLTYSRPNADRESVYRQAKALGYEGIVAKRLGSPYRPGKASDDWIEIKTAEAMELY